MKNVTYIFMFCVTSTLAQIEVQNISQLTQVEQDQIAQYLKSYNEVILTSPNTDTLLFGVINEYRASKNVNKLTHSIRLDTLANMVIRHELKFEPVHYNQYAEMRPYCDLMGYENIHFGTGFYVDFDRTISHIESFNPSGILQSWINSPRHHKNLLADARVGTAMVLVVIWKNDNYYDIHYRAIYEADYKISRRELDEMYRKKNQELVKRKPKISRGG